MDNRFDIGLLVLRLGFCSLMIYHGVSKLPLLSDPSSFPDPLGVSPTVSLVLALISEIIAPILVILGLKTRWAVLPMIVTMIVAAFFVHGSDSFAKKELAILYFLVFIALFFTGAGKYAFDEPKES